MYSQQTSIRIRKIKHKRRGAIAALLAIMFMVIFAFVAMSIDTGYIANTKAELQRTADASAMAAIWEYADELADDVDVATAKSRGTTAAVNCSASNETCNNATTLPNSSVTWGHIADFDNIPSTLPAASNETWTNAVQVQVEKTAQQNGTLHLFFGRMAGRDSTDLYATATAALVREIQGLTSPSDGSNLGFLPIALDLQTWNDLMNGIGSDNYTWNESTGTITSGGDGVLEVSLYPTGTGAPGNRGMVDVGSNNNSTADIARQITDGVSAADLAHHGGSLELDSNGELILNGDTGISAGVKDELDSIKGEPRIVPIFATVQGPGNNAYYTIVKFVGIRIMYVKLTGKKGNKRVVIQPAPMMTKGVIPSTGESDTSDYIYSNVVLVR